MTVLVQLFQRNKVLITSLLKTIQAARTQDEIYVPSRVTLSATASEEKLHQRVLKQLFRGKSWMATFSAFRILKLKKADVIM